MDARAAERWLRLLAEDAIAGSVSLETVRGAAGTLVEAGALAESRADNVLAETACALALRGLLPADQLGPRAAATGAGVADRSRSWSVIAAPPPFHGLVTSGREARLVGWAPAGWSDTGGLHVGVRARDGETKAHCDGPVVANGWEMRVAALEHPLDGPIEVTGAPGSAPIRSAPPVAVAVGPGGVEEGSPGERTADEWSAGERSAGEWSAGERHLYRMASAALFDGAWGAAQGAAAACVAAGWLPAAAPLVVAASEQRGLPPAWMSVLDSGRPEHVPARASTTVSLRVGVGLEVWAVVPGPRSFVVAAHVTPWDSSAGPSRPVPGDNTGLTWWAFDDVGGWYVGRVSFAARLGSGADVGIVFRPPIDPAAGELTLVIR